MIRLDTLVNRIVERVRPKPKPPALTKILVNGRGAIIEGRNCVCRMR